MVNSWAVILYWHLTQMRPLIWGYYRLCGWFSNSRGVLCGVQHVPSTRSFLSMQLRDMWLCICLQIPSNYNMQICQRLVMVLVISVLVISVRSALWPLAPYLWWNCQCSFSTFQLVCRYWWSSLSFFHCLHLMKLLDLESSKDHCLRNLSVLLVTNAKIHKAWRFF